MDKNNNTNIHIYLLLKIFKSSFPNTKPKFQITREFENIVKSLKPKNTYEYHGISSNLFRNAPYMLVQFEIVYVICLTIKIFS